MSKIKYLQKKSFQRNKKAKRHKDKISKKINNMNNNLRSNLNKKSKEKGKNLGNNNLSISKSSK